MLFIQSRAFIRQRDAGDALAAGNRGYVYLIARFDDDDSSICFFGSMGYRPEALLTGIGGVTPVTLVSFKAIRRIQRSDRPATFIAGREYVPIDTVPVISDNQGGAHAEELFLRKLPVIFEEYGTPRKIDIFVSRIPCAATSTGWALALGGNNMILPCGCSNKMRVVMEYNSEITWRIWWRDPYSNIDTQQQCLTGLAKLAGPAIVQQYVQP
jgi:hypothetical protein